MELSNLMGKLLDVYSEYLWKDDWILITSHCLFTGNFGKLSMPTAEG